MPTVATLLIVLSCLSLTTFAQSSNVTVRDIDPRITFNPLCSPPNQLCHGGWYSYNFSSVEKRTMTFGPSEETRYVLPSATFEFNGTAIYYYAVSSAKAASVSISIDGGTSSLVNLTQIYHLNASSGIYFPVYAWSATNLDPNKEHTFYLEYAQSNPSGAGLWAGFDSLVYTPSTPTVDPSTSTPTPTPSVSYVPAPTTSSPGVNGKLIGGIFAGTLTILVVAFAFTYWCVRHRERRSEDPLYVKPAGSNWSTIDGYSTRPVTVRSSAVPGSLPAASRPVSGSAPPRSSLDSTARSAITRITTAIATVITPYRSSARTSLQPPPRQFSQGIPSAPSSPHSSTFTPMTPGNDPFGRLPRPLPAVPELRSPPRSYTQDSLPTTSPSQLFSSPFNSSATPLTSSPITRGPSLSASAVLAESRPPGSPPNSVALLARQQQEIRELLERQLREQEEAGMDMSVFADDVQMMPLRLNARDSYGSLSASESGRRSRPVSTGNSARSWLSDRKVDPEDVPPLPPLPPLPTAAAETPPSPGFLSVPHSPSASQRSFGAPRPSPVPPPPPPLPTPPVAYSNPPTSFRHTLASVFGFSAARENATEIPTVHPRSNLARSHTMISSSTWRTQATAPPAYSPN